MERRAGLILTLCIWGVASAVDICEWVRNDTYTTFKDLHANKPGSCELQSEFESRVRQKCDLRIVDGVFSPDAAEKWVQVWNSFVPTYTTDVEGVRRVYKCTTNETDVLYEKLMAAVIAVSDQNEGLSEEKLDRALSSQYFVMPARHAIVDNVMIQEKEVVSDMLLTSHTVLAAQKPFGVAAFTLNLQTPGSYTMYVRARGFTKNSNSFYAARKILGWPLMKVDLEGDQLFHWLSVASGDLETAGVHRIHLLSRERMTEIETVLIHSNSELPEYRLDALAAKSSAVLISAEHGDLGSSPSFVLKTSPSSPTGKLLESIADADPVILSGTTRLRAAYSVYVHVRALSQSAAIEIQEVSSADGNIAGAYVRSETLFEVPTAALDWVRIGTIDVQSDVRELVTFGVAGSGIQLSSAILHISSTLSSEVLNEMFSLSVDNKASVCGNSVLEAGEDCDSSDGCSTACMCKAGWYSDKNGNCYTTCGDKVQAGSESCDGTENCLESCTCKPGFKGVGGECVNDCGDGVVVGGEDCDGGPGCSAQCTCETDYRKIAGGGCRHLCDGRGTITSGAYAGQCNPVCGDGVADAWEECDGTEECRDDCKCRRGYAPAEGGECIQSCGDGVVMGSEECDGTPGCTDSCKCDKGFKRLVHGGCGSVCGDGYVTVDEECDGTPGCGADCKCSSGFGSCIATQKCGNGRIEEGEECDGGTGCTSNCHCRTSFGVRAQSGCFYKRTCDDIRPSYQARSRRGTVELIVRNKRDFVMSLYRYDEDGLYVHQEQLHPGQVLFHDFPAGSTWVVTDWKGGCLDSDVLTGRRRTEYFEI